MTGIEYQSHTPTLTVPGVSIVVIHSTYIVYPLPSIIPELSDLNGNSRTGLSSELRVRTTVVCHCRLTSLGIYNAALWSVCPPSFQGLTTSSTSRIWMVSIQMALMVLSHAYRTIWSTCCEVRVKFFCAGRHQSPRDWIRKQRNYFP